MKVIDYIKGRGLPVLDSQTYRDWIDLWWQWYQGYVPKTHDYYVRTTTTRRKKFKRYTLGMAKTICEDYATLLLNEKAKIEVDGFDNLSYILDDNRFYERANRLVEITMALGTGAFVEFKDVNDRIRIDYLRADMIFPMRWDGDEIIDCAFASVLNNGIDDIRMPLYYVQIHTRQEDGQYTVENVFLDKKTGKKVSNPDSIEEITAPTPVPMFQIIRPNAYNAIDPYSPMGMSVYGMSLTQLEACDIIYDSFVNEFSLGKKRIMVPQTQGQIMLTSTGKVEPYFDPNDAVFHVYKVSENSEDKMHEIDFHLRVEEHMNGIQRALDILSKKCGLGTSRYSFDTSGVPAKTATEIISEDDDLYQSIKRNEKPIELSIIDMVQALGYLDNGKVDYEATISFDDSVFEDTGTIVKRNMDLVSAGLRSKIDAIMEIDHCDEKAAQEKLKTIASEQMVQPGSVDLLMGNE